MDSIFSAYSGIDGTSIWAAATSSKAALHVHLLACMLARLFNAPEAISIWVELVKEQRTEIATKLERGEPLPFSLAAAAGQNDIPRAQLAEWDASARAWLLTADRVKKQEYDQFRTLLENIDEPVSASTHVFPSVINAWKSALRTMEDLVTGLPQATQNGAIILGLSAWHLYPDLAIFGPQNFQVHMDDNLIQKGGVLSLGLKTRKSSDSSGVFWCLSLAHLRHYGKPVRTERRLPIDPSRLSLDQFMVAALGAILGRWKILISKTTSAVSFFYLIDDVFKGTFKLRQPLQMGPHHLQYCQKLLLEYKSRRMHSGKHSSLWAAPFWQIHWRRNVSRLY